MTQTDSDHDSTRSMANILSDYQECIDRAYTLYQEVVNLHVSVQNRDNLIELSRLLEQYRTKP